MSQEGQYALVSYIAMPLTSKRKLAVKERNIDLALGSEIMWKIFMKILYCEMVYLEHSFG